MKIIMHVAQEAQILLLQIDKAFTKVSSKYSNYADIFSFNHLIELLENTGMNEHTIKLENNKQLSYRSIYKLRLVKLEIIKLISRYT